MRRPIKPHVRFRIFERDGFACRYCGRSAPDVVLHVDHVHPVSRGGTDHPDNLCTACSACNAGKAGEPLGMLVDDQRCHALSFIAAYRIMDRFGPEFAAEPHGLLAISDFMATDDRPESLLPFIAQAESWAHLKRLWLAHQDFPEDFWSPSQETTPQ